MIYHGYLSTLRDDFLILSFITIQYLPYYVVYHTKSSIAGHLGCFQDCAVINDAIMSNFIHESSLTCIGTAVGYIPRGGTVLPKG